MIDISVLGSYIGECCEKERLSSQDNLVAFHGCIFFSLVFLHDDVPNGGTLTINYETGEFRYFVGDDEVGVQMAPLINF